MAKKIVKIECGYGNRFKVANTIITMKNRGATPRCFNRVPEGKKDA